MLTATIHVSSLGEFDSSIEEVPSISYLPQQPYPKAGNYKSFNKVYPNPKPKQSRAQHECKPGTLRSPCLFRFLALASRFGSAWDSRSGLF